ncbi:MAG: hypothetical protein Q7T04_04990, partial [Dehalococcoidia bacterium]|nr:hypothetical protein [Dehalococcoidia bacterium]
ATGKWIVNIKGASPALKAQLTASDTPWPTAPSWSPVAPSGFVPLRTATPTGQPSPTPRPTPYPTATARPARQQIADFKVDNLNTGMYIVDDKTGKVTGP